MSDALFSPTPPPTRDDGISNWVRPSDRVHATTVLDKLQIAGAVERFERCANSAEGMLKSGQIAAACLMAISIVEQSIDVMLFARGEVYWEDEVSEIRRIENFSGCFGASNPVVAEALELLCPPTRLTFENAAAYVARCLVFALSTARIRSAGMPPGIPASRRERHDFVRRWAAEADQMRIVPTRYRESYLKATLSGDRSGELPAPLSD